MYYGMWIDANSAANPTVGDFYGSIIKKYYDYDGYILMMNAIINSSMIANDDKLVVCIQDEPAKTTHLSCAIYTKNPTTGLTYNTKKIETPEICKTSGFAETAISFGAEDPSLWPQTRNCNDASQSNDGTLNCWGQRLSTINASSQSWVIWKWQASLGAPVTSGFRFATQAPYYSLVSNYKAPTGGATSGTWRSRGGSITMPTGAESIITASALLAAGVIATLF
jgi:hypothetical protein